MTLDALINFRISFSLRSVTKDVRSSSSLRSSAGTLRRIPQAVSTVTSSPLFSLPFSQGLEMCGPHRRFTPLLPRTLRRIPQAVGTVATCHSRQKRCNYPWFVSIPQAVGAIATWQKTMDTNSICCQSFNTASSKHYYFITFVFPSLRSGTRDVRISSSLRSSAVSHPSSYTTSGRCCCNTSNHQKMLQKLHGFNTASSKCCCNILA